MVTTAIYGKHPLTDENICVNATIDGFAWSVPLDGSYDENDHWSGNSLYKEIIDWVAEGNTITPAP